MPRGTPVYTLERALATQSLAPQVKRLSVRRVNDLKARYTKARVFTMAQVKDLVQKEVAAQAALSPRHPVVSVPRQLPNNRSFFETVATAGVEIATSREVRAAASYIGRGVKRVVRAAADPDNHRRAVEGVKSFVKSPAVQNAATSAVRLLTDPRALAVAVGVTVVAGAVLWMTGMLPF